MLDRFDLTGKVALVTGASSGLGAAFAVGLGQAGADLVLGARRAHRLAQTRDAIGELGRKAIAVPTDVPMGRVGDVGELTAALVFLASDASTYINGQILVVDGGLTIA